MSYIYEREVAVFEAALELSPAERRAYLERTCAGDAELLARVEGLLELHETNAGILASAASDATSATRPSFTHTEKPGDLIGPYKLLQQIGEGGCGVVYMAEQETPIRRRVALKIIKLGMDTRQVIARFEAERQALALMDHPNIAKVHDAGATSTGRPYFVMELVRGVKITDYCDEKRLPTRQRLELFIQVCQAVQHAHQKGIIHRDLKPSNILVTVNDGVAVPKVIDFGIAKATDGERLTDKTIFTAFEQFIGTPAYMSPEQAEISSVDIDTRSDIYSLGVLLYELLTGQTPFDAKKLLKAGLEEMRRTLREEEPARPSTRLSTLGVGELTTTAQRRGLEGPKLVNVLRGDLDWIVMKCLEKDRGRRYETTNGLAMDIQRHLKNEPVVARPPNKLYEFQKTVRRHKVGFATTGAVMLALLLGLGVSTRMFLDEREAKREQARLRLEANAKEQQAKIEAEKSRQVARFLEDMLQGVSPAVAMGRDTTLLKEILDKAQDRVEHELTNEPEVEVELMDTVGAVHYAIVSPGKGEAILRRALAIAVQSWGTNNLLVARSMDLLANSLAANGSKTDSERLAREGGAEQFAREGLRIRRQLLGSNDEAVATSLHSVASTIYLQPGKGAEASALEAEALRIRRMLFGETNLLVARSLSFLAVCLSNEGNVHEAEKMLRAAISIEKALQGTNSWELIRSLNDVAQILHQEAFYARQSSPADRTVAAAKYAEAEACFREGRGLNWRFLEFSVSGSDLSLALMLREQGKLQDVDELLDEALGRAKGDLKREDPTLALRAGFKIRDGQFAEAASELSKAAALKPGDATRTYQWIAALAASGNYLAYKNACEQMLRRFSKSTNISQLAYTANICLLLPSSPAQTADAGNLAEKAAALEMQQDKPERFLFALGLAAYRRGDFSRVVSLAQSQTNSDKDVEATCVLSMTLERLGRTAEATASLAKALELAHKLPPPETWQFSSRFHEWLVGRILLREARQLVAGHPPQNAYEDLASALRTTSSSAAWSGRLPEAETLLRRALALYGPGPGEEDYGLACTLLQLSVVLKSQGKASEGREMADRARAVLKSHVVSALDDYEATADLAELLGTCRDAEIRDGAMALVLAQKAVEATGRKDRDLLDVLAAAHAEAGDFDGAVKAEQEAIAMSSHGDAIKVLTSRLNLYQTHTAIRRP